MVSDGRACTVIFDALAHYHQLDAHCLLCSGSVVCCNGSSSQICLVLLQHWVEEVAEHLALGDLFLHPYLGRVNFNSSSIPVIGVRSIFGLLMVLPLTSFVQGRAQAGVKLTA